MDPLAQLLSHQLLGDLLGDQFDQCLGGLLLEGHLGLDDVPLAEPLGDVGAELVGGLELRGLRRPLVGHLGQDQLLHVLDQHLERHGLAPAIDRRVEGEDVAGLGPAQLVVELGHHAPAAHLVEKVLGVEVAVVRRRQRARAVPWMSMVTWSPSWAGRATSTSSPDVARRRSICASISSSVTSRSGRVTTRP